MQITVVSEIHFEKSRTEEHSESNTDLSLWNRYLDVFDSIRIVARVDTTDPYPSPTRPRSKSNVNYWPVPSYVGPIEFLRKIGPVTRSIWKAVGESEAIILRVPGLLGSIAAISAWAQGRAFALEVVGNPRESLAALKIPGGRPLSIMASALLKWSIRQATATAYVTTQSLQTCYPARPGVFTTDYSSISLPSEAVLGVTPERLARAQRCAGGKMPWRLGFVGTFNVMYKAPEIHLEATRILIDRGFLVELSLIGDGTHRTEMEFYARTLGLEKNVRFHGQVDEGDSVLEILDQSDVFLIASRTEGLPRALIEAMARGCPAIGSDVGGIPELLPASSLVAAGSALALADRVEAFLSDPSLMKREGERNARTAAGYTEEILRPKRNEFYSFVRSTAIDQRGQSVG